MNDLLLVGSVPYFSAEDVLRTVSGKLGPYLRRIPDGEVLDRRYWIVRMNFQVFNGHPDLDLVQRPASVDGVETLIPRDMEDSWIFRLKAGRERLTFDFPGWRLGYAKDAIASYGIFAALKREGVIGPSTRFQVSIPSVNSVCNTKTFGTDLVELEIIRAGFQGALVAEVRTIAEHIPSGELAIQYDCSWEVTDVYGAAGLAKDDAIERNVAQFGPLAAALPADVDLGLHLCFGTFGGWPRFRPDDLSEAVNFANAIAAKAGRSFTWMHIPALDTSADAFYAPLRNLDVGEARIYLGLIHSMTDFGERLEVARRYLPEFGLAAYCGFGRLSEEEADRFLDDHLAAMKIAAASR